MFIGYVNKLKSNYDNIQHNSLMNLFLSHTVVHFMNLYYGSLTLMNLIKYEHLGICLYVHCESCHIIHTRLI